MAVFAAAADRAPDSLIGAPGFGRGGLMAELASPIALLMKRFWRTASIIVAAAQTLDNAMLNQRNLPEAIQPVQENIVAP